MRKILSLALAALMIVSAFAFVSCGEKAAKLGLGVATTVSATNATEEKAGSVKTAATVAAVLLPPTARSSPLTLTLLRLLSV